MMKKHYDNYSGGSRRGTLDRYRRFLQFKKEWFQQVLNLELKNGVPSDDTFRRIFAIIKPDELEKSFVSWVKAINELTDGEIVSIDGKTICGSRDQQGHVIHMVSAWANQASVVLGKVRTDVKSNEITAIPELLELLELKGFIITADAMGCQKKIVENIVSHECDYVLSLKGNQETLHEDIKLYFDTAAKEPEFFPLLKTRTVSKDHGCMEKRCYYLTDDVNWIGQKGEWGKLSAIGMVHSVRIIDGIETSENRYFLSSVTDVKQFARAVRAHWGIENTLHWCLDTAFHEDKCRMRVDNSGENFAIIRHIALNLLKSHPEKLSLRRKKFRCQFDTDFLYDVIFKQIAPYFSCGCPTLSPFLRTIIFVKQT